jgi:serpin B
VLPKAVDGLKDVEAGLDAAALSALLRPGPSVEVELRLPKFEIRAACDLREALVEMGIRDAFSRDRADFSGMTGKRGFFLGSVVHRSFVTVNEVGTEAGAATAIETASGIPENVVDFAVDHPFLFLVADWKTGAVLFMGRVADPAK